MGQEHTEVSEVLPCCLTIIFLAERVILPLSFFFFFLFHLARFLIVFCYSFGICSRAEIHTDQAIILSLV
jgi:hypothetical protein